MPILIVAINLLSGQLFYQASRMYIPLAFILIIFTSFLEQLKNKKIIYFILIILILLSTVLTSSKLKNFKDGLTLLAAVDEEKPNYNTILANLYSYNLLKNGNINKASEKIREIAVITGYKNAYNLYLLAVINIYEGNYQQAINILEPIINFDKKDILIKLFICYKYIGNADKSAYYYNQAVELTGTSEITDNLIYRQEEDLKNVKI
jgi:tetratricopeptide (TPR) repeat protein